MTGIMQAFIHNLPRPPTKAEREADLAGKTLNPIKLITMLTWLQHAHFWTAWLAWTCDAYGESEICLFDVFVSFSEQKADWWCSAPPPSVYNP